MTSIDPPVSTSDMKGPQPAVGATGSPAQFSVGQSSAEDSWANEGGCFFESASSPSPGPTRSQSMFTEWDGLAKRMHEMAGNLSSDFAHGRIGTRHHIFEHRSRVLRQLTDRVDEKRPPILRDGEQLR